ncbi:3-deoxy-D-manno-octulosonic acid kinase [Celerinatantimonas yamalensis]|uniref:3-deoxy-D-manno-octulosonic acid kinase n=1 Tax=Celerinatantimonas yamalensis TaxID=559956 RepID=A0ABW9GBB1_9GAMM
MNIIKQSEKPNWIWFNGNIWRHCTSEFFEPSYWHRQHAVVGQANGRGQVVFFQYLERQFVLRHYCRGGLMGQLVSRDHYLYLGKALSRCWQEFELLSRLQQMNLPAPVPVAAQLVRDGLFYRADLITQRIEQAQDLSQLLMHQRLSSAIWAKVGATIRLFHEAGVDHSDLNIHNIMLDADEKVWIIDLDKSRIRKPALKWQQANLDRLYRSLEKERQQLPHWYWLKSDWLLLVQGYRGMLQ